jgi:UDP-N-acetylglucosamine 2-epimerase
MKILTVVGARPQFIKAAAVSHLLRRNAVEVLLHTGQHYDDAMSDQFFRELELPAPDYSLGVGSGSHGAQTAAMLTGIEAAIVREQPDRVLVYGDTNSTLAGALAAIKLHVPVAHVEAGLRSFNRRMPEEINRIVADHLAAWLFCPSQSAVDNLRAEGITGGVQLVGDVMIEGLARAGARARRESSIVERLQLVEQRFVLATIHRAENTDDPATLSRIIDGLGRIGEPVVFPVHPRTRHAMAAAKISPGPGVTLIDPVGYLDNVRLQSAARVVVTDSGGMQKEAYWLGVPCVTVREQTEWIETIAAGWNRLVAADADAIASAVADCRPGPDRPPLYGDGQAASRIVGALETADGALRPRSL